VTHLYNTFQHWAEGAQITQAGMATDGTSPGAIVINNITVNTGSANLVATSAAALQGTMGARLTLTASPSYIRYDEPTTGARGVLRKPVKIPSNPSAETVIADIRDTANAVKAQLMVSSTGLLRVSSKTTAVAASNYQLTVGTQYWAEMVVVSGTTTGQVGLYVYAADGTTLLNNSGAGYLSAANLDTTAADCKYFSDGRATTASGWTTRDMDSFQGGVLASGLWGPLPNETLPPSIVIDTPAPNLRDLRGSIAGDGSVPVYPTPVHVSGPTLSVTSLDPGLWLFSQDATTASVYTMKVTQDDTQLTTQDVTIDPLPVGIVHQNAPLIPTGPFPSTTWA
jgi:hypothetical protein